MNTYAFPSDFMHRVSFALNISVELYTSLIFQTKISSCSLTFYVELCLEKHYHKQTIEGSFLTGLAPILLNGQYTCTDRKIYLKVYDKSVRFDLLYVKCSADTD